MSATPAGRIARTLAAIEYHALHYRGMFLATLATTIVTPLLYYLAIGELLGRHVDATRFGSDSYIDHLAPALIPTFALQLVVAATVNPVVACWKWTDTYATMRTSPMTAGEIGLGHVSFVWLRLVLSCLIYTAIAQLFLHDSLSAAARWFTSGLVVGMSMSTVLYALAVRVNHDATLALVSRLVVLPMTFLSGAFFPYDQLPAPLRQIAVVSPLTHGTSLATGADESALGVVLRIAYLAAIMAAGAVASRSALRNRLEV
ncbi:ABC transporter permease [Kribbella sp. NPDC056345]|uniref:ABC transporter permease n=1 Tax=Kribbella sp. NPDC056345 TaxID=3345789 RepID=UPI0035D69857